MQHNQFDILLNIAKELNDLYIEKKNKLPYHFNLIDELRANENAHSRILVSLLQYQDRDTYPILTQFLKGLELPYDCSKSQCLDFTAEVNRIDALVIDRNNSWALIIENKIYGAQDQPGQIENYIRTVKRKGVNFENIFVVYLSKEGGEPSSSSLSEETKSRLEDRYKEINYKNHILPWLEQEVLPFCRFKDVLLISALQQYIDYLRGFLSLRKMDKEMNQELKQYLKEKLKVNSTENPINQLQYLEKNLTMLEGMQGYIKELFFDVNIKLLADWRKQAESHPTNHRVVDNLDSNEYFLYFGVVFQKEGKEFTCAMGADKGNNLPYYGISARGIDGSEKHPAVEQLVAEKFPGYSCSDCWYAYKFLSVDKPTDYFSLLDELINL